MPTLGKDLKNAMTAPNTPQSPQAPSPGVATRSRILDSLPSQARITSEQAAARSRVVRHLRIALPVLALVLVIALLLNTRSQTSDRAILNDFADITANPEEVRMANPRFAGVDNEGKPYVITAEAAIQRADSDDIVELDHPRAVTHDDNNETVVTANKGLFRSKGKVLELSEEVTLERSIGSDNYSLRTPAATVLIDDKTVTSDQGVTGVGPSGETLRADRMRAYNENGKIIFEGNVSMRIFPKSLNTESEVSPEDETGDKPK